METVTILLGFALIALLYGAVPILFAATRKSPVPKSRITLVTILASFVVSLFNICFGEYPSTSSLLVVIALAFFWSFLSYKIACDMLDIKGLLPKEGEPQKPVIDITDMTTEIIEEYHSDYMIPPRPVKEPEPEVEPEPAPVPDPSSDALAFEIRPPIMPEPEDSPPAPPAKSAKAIPIWSWILTGVLAIACVALAVVSVCAYQQIDHLEGRVDTLQSNNENQKRQLEDAKAEVRELKDEVAALDFMLDWTMDQLDHIGFIVSGSRRYHHFTCNTYLDADSYWAYNVENCIGQGYTRCPDCWSD